MLQFGNADPIAENMPRPVFPLTSFCLLLQLLTASSSFLHVTILLVKSLQLHLSPYNWLISDNLNLYKVPDNAVCHRIYSKEFRIIE